ncbi:MAG TPA: hypothetical protein VID76_08990 [Solirubrobacterales bacterium]|jgi:hypothetical protein
MSRGLRGTLVAVGGTLVVFAATAPGANAAVTVGSKLANPADGTVCGPALPSSCTASIAGLITADAAAGGAKVPTAGVIVSWQIKYAGGTAISANLRVIRANAGVGRSAAGSLSATPGTYEFPTRLPVQAGDQIGVDLPTGLVGIGVAHVATGDLLNEWQPALAEGSATAPTSSPNNVELLLSAKVEADADGDGFGDETQDACPSNPATQLACGVGAPDTTITKKPKKKSTKTKATVEFTADPVGSVFQCSLDSVAYTSCTSPLKLKRLHKGKHILLVRAIAFGIPDETPAKARFTVLKKKKKHH